MLYGFQAYLQGTVDWGCSLFIQFPNLPQGDCQLWFSLFNTVSKRICRWLSVRDAACFYCFWTFLQEVQPVYTVLETTSRDLFTCGAAYLYSFQTFLQGTVRQRCSLVIQFLNLPPGTVRIHNTNFIYSRKSNLPPGNFPWCSQCMWFPNLPSGDCRLGV